jgi:hypothetical protein
MGVSMRGNERAFLRDGSGAWRGGLAQRGLFVGRPPRFAVRNLVEPVGGEPHYCGSRPPISPSPCSAGVSGVVDASVGYARVLRRGSILDVSPLAISAGANARWKAGCNVSAVALPQVRLPPQFVTAWKGLVYRAALCRSDSDSALPPFGAAFEEERLACDR